MAIIFAQAATRAITRSATRSGAPNPTGAPVLRGSLEEGTFEHRFFRVYQPKETDRLRKAAVQVADMYRQERRDIRVDRVQESVKAKLPTLTPAAVRVYEWLCEGARIHKGPLYPTYDTMSKALVLGRATIARALKQLKEAGFLAIQRRCKRIESEGPGPRFTQTSNAYRLEWPKRLAQWVGYRHAPCPLPDDEQFRLQERQQAFTQSAPIETDNSLDSALERLERALDERESHKDTQPLYINNNISKKDEMSWPSRPTLNP